MDAHIGLVVARHEHDLVAAPLGHARQPVAALGVGRSLDDVHAVEGVVGHLVALDRDPRQRLLRVLVADHADDRLGRCGHVPEVGPVVGGDRARFAVAGLARPFNHFDGLSRPRQDAELLAGDSWPVELHPDEAVAADAREPEAALRVRRDLRRQRDGVFLEILLLKLKAQAFLALDGFEPGTEVFPGGRVDLQHAEGRAGNRLPFEINDLAGDRHVVLHQLKREVVPLAVCRDHYPTGTVVCRHGPDEGWHVGAFRFRDGELEAAVGSGGRILGRRFWPVTARRITR